MIWEPSEALAAKAAHLKEKLAKLAIEMRKLDAYETEVLASPDQQISQCNQSFMTHLRYRTVEKNSLGLEAFS